MIAETETVQLETTDGQIMGRYRRIPQWSLGHQDPRLACFNAAGKFIGTANSVPEARDVVLTAYTNANAVPFHETTKAEPFRPITEVA